MGVRVYSLLWEMQDLYHQPYHRQYRTWGVMGVGFWAPLEARLLLRETRKGSKKGPTRIPRVQRR